MAREYSVWNTKVATLQFWMADIEVHVLCSAIEHVYYTFFYTTSMHLLCQQPDKVLFGCFMTTLNAAFESKLALEDKGYESSSEYFNIPTPLRRTTKIHHIPSVENASFDPDPVTPCSTGTREPHHIPVCRCLTLSSSEENDDDTPAGEFPSPDLIPPVQYHQDDFQQPSFPLNMSITLDKGEEMEEDFQMILLKDEHLNEEEIPDRHLYIHEHSLPHALCPYPCPYLTYQTSSYYDTLDLSDISEFEDLMTTSSNENIPPLEDIGY